MLSWVRRGQGLGPDGEGWAEKWGCACGPRGGQLVKDSHCTMFADSERRVKKVLNPWTFKNSQGTSCLNEQLLNCDI